MVNDEKYIIAYPPIKNKKIDNKKILILALILLLAIFIAIIINSVSNIVTQHKVYEQYEAQLQAIKQKEEETQRKIEEEAERIRQERIPKLTDERKSKYGKYLSFRNKKSIFNI